MIMMHQKHDRVSFDFHALHLKEQKRRCSEWAKIPNQFDEGKFA